MAATAIEFMFNTLDRLWIVFQVKQGQHAAAKTPNIIVLDKHSKKMNSVCSSTEGYILLKSFYRKIQALLNTTGQKWKQCFLQDSQAKTNHWRSQYTYLINVSQIPKTPNSCFILMIIKIGLIMLFLMLKPITKRIQVLYITSKHMGKYIQRHFNNILHQQMGNKNTKEL